jgi:hypothetical protein
LTSAPAEPRVATGVPLAFTPISSAHPVEQ